MISLSFKVCVISGLISVDFLFPCNVTCFLFFICRLILNCIMDFLKIALWDSRLYLNPRNESFLFVFVDKIHGKFQTLQFQLLSVVCNSNSSPVCKDFLESIPLIHHLVFSVECLDGGLHLFPQIFLLWDDQHKCHSRMSLSILKHRLGFTHLSSGICMNFLGFMN